MKWKLYILLFAMTVFLGETISIPAIANANTGKKMCRMHMAVKGPAKKDCCQRKSKPAMNCIDCPLCYLTVSTPFANYFFFTQINKIAYSDFINTSLSGFNVENWKPPDA